MTAEFDFSKHELIYAREEDDGTVYATYRPIGWKGTLASADQIKDTVDHLFKVWPSKVEQLRRNNALIGWFVGQAMKAFAGRADPEMVLTYCRTKLEPELYR